MTDLNSNTLHDARNAVGRAAQMADKAQRSDEAAAAAVHSAKKAKKEAEQAAALAQRCAGAEAAAEAATTAAKWASEASMYADLTAQSALQAQRAAEEAVGRLKAAQAAEQKAVEDAELRSLITSTLQQQGAMSCQVMGEIIPQRLRKVYRDSNMKLTTYLNNMSDVVVWEGESAARMVDLAARGSTHLRQVIIGELESNGGSMFGRQLGAVDSVKCFDFIYEDAGLKQFIKRTMQHDVVLTGHGSNWNAELR